MSDVKWSFSGLKDYINCPRQYNEVKLLKKYTKAVTHQMTYGTEVHKALEDYGRDGAPLAENYLRFKKTVDALLAIPGDKYFEYEMALNTDKEPCSFHGPDYWVRGIVDFMVVDGDTAFIVDYKTGSAKYPDTKQLKLMALMTLAHMPQVNKVRAALLFLMHNTFISEEYTREDIDKLWLSFSADVARLKMSLETGAWPANPTPLCGWCPVKHCEYHRGR